MKRFLAFLKLVIITCLILACKTEPATMVNPFISEYRTLFGVPPFNLIRTEHFMPAIDSAIKLHNREIDALINNPEAADFENTIVALDRSGTMFNQVSRVFFGLYSADASAEMQAISGDFRARVSAHSDDINLNSKLFKRVQEVRNFKDSMSLSQEQRRLLDNAYKQFVRNGVNLPESDKERLREINLRLTELTNEFDKNLLAETNNFKLIIDSSNDLEGLPDDVINTAAATAKELGMEGKWVITPHIPSMIPFLQYSSRKELRKKIYNAYCNRGNTNNEYDNKKIIAEMTNLRVEKAHLLGFPSFAAFILDDRMAKTPDAVYELLDRVWNAALPIAEKEKKEMQAIIDREGGNFQLEAEDWWYYAEKLRKEKYKLDENEIRPYLELNNVIEGVFIVSNRLYGLSFEKITDDFPRPHPDAVTYKVKDINGRFLGILYMDFYTRPTKSQGAWCGSYRGQFKTEKEDIRPIVTIVTNFSNPVGNESVLLSLDETLTLFHEFGHGLHNLLSDVSYESISGTAVKRDFVELPSQIMENWATRREVLQLYAKHYKTSEVIPDELIEKIKGAEFFNQGFTTVELVAASYLDMNYHILKEQVELDIDEFEKEYLDSIGLIPEILPRYRSTYFKHIWSHAYSAGYYSYLWAEVLDKDAFEAFIENGIFDKETADAFRENILSKGNSADPMELYIRFRGHKPAIEPLLKGRGLL
jgi:peptidyl-dipeptidase Dcp